MKYEPEVDEQGRIEVAFNVCYGGFGISKRAILLMIEYGSEEAKKCYAEAKEYGYTFGSYIPNVPRFDPILIRVIKELKKHACAESCELAICKIRLDDLIQLEEHDGKEEIRGGYETTYYRAKRSWEI